MVKIVLKKDSDYVFILMHMHLYSAITRLFRPTLLRKKKPAYSAGFICHDSKSITIQIVIVLYCSVT